MNGKIWKKLTGGGDDQVARRNYDRTDTHFKIDTTFMLMGNNDLQYDAKDTVEHRIEFHSVNQFKSQNEIDKMRASGIEERFINSFKIKNPKIKDDCATDAWRKATIYLIYEHYVESALTDDSNCGDADEAEMTLRQSILAKYEITENISDCIICVNVDNQFVEGKKKVWAELESMGVIKKKSNRSDETRNLQCYYGLLKNPEFSQPENSQCVNVPQYS